MATQIFTGQFKIKQWDEVAVVEHDQGVKQTRASIIQEYSGELVGSSCVEYIMQYQSAMSAEFVGYEEITVGSNGHEICFLVRHIGTFSEGIAKSDCVVVSQKDSTKYTLLSGFGKFEAGAGGVANYEFSLTFQ